MPTIAPSPAFLRKMPATDGLLRSIDCSFRPDHLDQKDRGTITTKDRAVKVGQNRLKAVDEFCYLGGTVSSNCSIGADITLSRIAKASTTFGRLTRRLWNTRDVHLSTKLAVDKAAVSPSVAVNCEIWTMYCRQIRQLDSFHMRCLRPIAGISRKDRVTSIEVPERCRTRGIEAHIRELKKRGRER